MILCLFNSFRSILGVNFHFDPKNDENLAKMADFKGKNSENDDVGHR